MLRDMGKVPSPWHTCAYICSYCVCTHIYLWDDTGVCMCESFSVNPHHGYGETEAQSSLKLHNCGHCHGTSASTYFSSVWDKIPNRKQLEWRRVIWLTVRGCGWSLGWVGKSTEPCPSPHFLLNSARESSAWCTDGTALVLRWVFSSQLTKSSNLTPSIQHF